MLKMTFFWLLFRGKFEQKTQKSISFKNQWRLKNIKKAMVVKNIIAEDMPFTKSIFEQFWRSYCKKTIFVVFHFLKFLPLCGLVVDGTVDSKNNKEEKAWEVADIRIYHFSWKFLQLGFDMQWWWWLTWKFFILPTCLITFKSRVLMVNDTLDGKDNLEEKTREVADK